MLNRLSVAIVVIASGIYSASCENRVASAPDVEAYRQLNQQLLIAVNTHCDNADAMSDTTTCPNERDRYQAEAKPLVEEMSRKSMEMDDCMMAMGRDSLAVMEKTCRGMNDELATHIETACGAFDVSEDIAEADRHCGAMREMVQQELERTDNMGQSGGMMSGMMSGGTCHD